MHCWPVTLPEQAALRYRGILKFSKALSTTTKAMFLSSFINTTVACLCFTLLRVNAILFLWNKYLQLGQIVPSCLTCRNVSRTARHRTHLGLKDFIISTLTFPRHLHDKAKWSEPIRWATKERNKTFITIKRLIIPHFVGQLQRWWQPLCESVWVTPLIILSIEKD